MSRLYYEKILWCLRIEQSLIGEVSLPILPPQMILVVWGIAYLIVVIHLYEC